MRRLSGSLCAVLLGLTLVGCSSGNNAETSGSVVTGALRQLISNRGEDAAPPKITATRAELEAAGLGAQPLLVVRMPDIGSESGFFLLDERDGVQSWQSGDNLATLQIRTKGPIVNSTGLGYDLYGADVAPVEAALLRGQDTEYGRRYRHLAKDLTTLQERLVYCTLEDQGVQTIEVFQRTHRTRAYLERCAAPDPHPDGRPFAFENRYWKGVSDDIIWVSEQWMSQDLGTVRTERVF